MMQDKRARDWWLSPVEVVEGVNDELVGKYGGERPSPVRRSQVNARLYPVFIWPVLGLKVPNAP